MPPMLRAVSRAKLLLLLAVAPLPGAALAAGCGSFIVTKPYTPPQAAAPARQEPPAEAGKAAGADRADKASAESPPARERKD